jgi:hypothetical protein
MTPTLMLLKLRAIIARPTLWSTLLSQKYRLSMYGMRYGPNMKRLQAHMPTQQPTAQHSTTEHNSKVK